MNGAPLAGIILQDAATTGSSAVLDPITDLVSTCLEDDDVGGGGDNNDGTSSNTAGLYGLWYTVTGGDEVLRVSTCDSDDWTVDTRISIYRGDCPKTAAAVVDEADVSHANLQCVGANDDFCGQHASVSWYAEKGINYFILVHSSSLSSSSSTAEVPFKIRVTYEDNGSCEKAIGPIDGSRTIGSMRGAKTDDVLLTCSFSFVEFGHVWYTVSTVVVLSSLSTMYH